MNAKMLFAAFAAFVVVSMVVVAVPDADATDNTITDVSYKNAGSVVLLVVGIDGVTEKELSMDYSVDGKSVKNAAGASIEALSFNDTLKKYNAVVPEAVDLDKHTVKIVVTDSAKNTYTYEKFTITHTAENGTITPSVEKAQKGETVTFTVDPSEGYELSGVPTVNGAAATAIEDGYSFVMPGEAVTISATFTKIVVPVYKVAIDEKIQNGTVTASKYSDIKEGDEVALTVAPASDDYTLVPGSLRVLDKDEKDVEVVDNKFWMPASDVTVTAQFALKTPCTVTYDDAVLTVTAGKEIIVSGTTVPAGTVLTVSAVEKLGYDAIVTPALTEGEYTVTKDVEFKVAYTEKEYSQETHSGNIESATVNGKSQWTITADSVIIAGAELVVDGKLVVPAGVTLTVAADAKLIINDKGVADIQGNLVVEAADTDADKDAGLVSVDGEMTLAGSVSIEGKIASAGKVVIASGSAAEIAGEIAGNYTVSEDASLTIVGGVADVEVGEQLAKSFFTVSGKLVVSSDVPTAGFDVKLSGKGALDIEKVVLGTTSKTTGEGKGTIIVTDDGIFYNTTDDKKLVDEIGKNRIEISGSLTVEASAGETSYENDAQYGATVTGVSVSVENSVAKVTEKGDRENQMKHVSVMSISGSVAVSEFVFYEPAYDEETTGPVATKDSLSAAFTAVGAEASTVKIGAALSFGKDIEASLKNVDIASPVTFVKELTLQNAAVNAAVTVPVGAKLAIAGTFDVKAAVDVSAVDAKKNTATLAVANDVVITVSGEGSLASYNAISKINKDAVVNATLYGEYVYVAFDKAVAALNAGTTKAVTVLGEQTLAASAEIPAIANAVILSEGSHLSIGSKDSTDVVLTVASGNGVVLKNAKSNGIEVYGTLYAEKMSNIDPSLRNGTVGDAGTKAISSDVYSCVLKTNGTPDTNGFAKWTNVYTALAEADPGQTVYLARNIELSKNLDVPAGVTLDAAGYGVTVDNGITLTVKGTLDLRNDSSKVVLASEVKNGDKVEKKAGAIAVEGYVAYSGALPIYDAASTGSPLAIPGAYYSVTDDKDKTVRYLTSYANGIADAAKADGYTGTDGEKNHVVELVAGTDGKISLGDFTVTGEKDAPAYLIVEDADLIVGTATLSYAAIVTCCSSTDSDAHEVHEVSGTFADANGSIAVKAKSDGFAVGSIDIAGVATLVVEGAVQDYKTEKGVDVDTYVTFSGKVLIGDLDATVDKAVFSASADVAIGYTEDEENYDATVEFGEKTEVSVEGAVAIRAGSSMTAEKLSVSGSIGIEDGKLTAAEATVTGSIDAKAVDKDGASIAAATFGILYVGVDGKIVKKDTSTGADASLVGNVTVSNYAIVAPGATVPEAFTKEDSEYKSTVFEVEGALYLTGYAGNDCDLLIQRIDYKPTDAEFKGWYVAGETEKTAAKIGGVAKVSAKIDYEIYKITITTDGGVAYITVDGVLMENVEGKANTFSIGKLKAGSHTIGISAASGYDVSNVVLKNTDGTAVGSMTVSVSGTTTDYEYQLIGSTVAVDPTPEPTPIIIKDEDDGMSLTDILLIVLVVLIVIMAAIVALRMMRS